MTRDAKIGMLTGLGVIVLIGVMLSNYLGDPHAMLPGYAGGAAGGRPTAEASAATGSMASLPVGAEYRKELTEPAGGAVGVPGMSPGGAGGAEAITTTNGIVPPTAFAADNGAAASARAAVPAPLTGPTVSGPVSPIAVGPLPAERANEGLPSVIMLADSTRTAPAAGADGGSSAARAATGSATYEIVAGDTLAKIARKFYSSSKPSDVQRIVAANPGVLKDATTSLVVSRKLVIPGVAVKTAPVVAKKVDAATVDGVLVPLPGDAGSHAQDKGAVAAKADASKKTAAGIYVVQAGDTLEKIAKKLSRGKSTDMVQKLISLNGIKDPDALQQGAKLKTPA